MITHDDMYTPSCSFIPCYITANKHYYVYVESWSRSRARRFWLVGTLKKWRVEKWSFFWRCKKRPSTTEVLNLFGWQPILGRRREFREPHLVEEDGRTEGLSTRCCYCFKPRPFPVVENLWSKRGLSEMERHERRRERERDASTHASPLSSFSSPVQSLIPVMNPMFQRASDLPSPPVGPWASQDGWTDDVEKRREGGGCPTKWEEYSPV